MPGASSFRSPSHFPAIDASTLTNPVILPPGRARLATKAAYRVGNGGENHRDDGCFALHGSGGGRGVDEDHIRIEADQFLRKGAVFVCVPGAVTKVDRNIAIECPAQVGETLQKGGNAPLRGRIMLGESNESTDPQHALGRLLRLRYQRPADRRAAKKIDEIAPSHASPHTQVEG